LVEGFVFWVIRIVFIVGREFLFLQNLGKVENRGFWNGTIVVFKKSPPYFFDIKIKPKLFKG
jgi:hypothetical protein